jgi:hypothetical protein
MVGAVGAAAIVIEKVFVEDWLLAPVTRTVNVAVPAVVGVPLRVPLLDSVMPAGGVPEASDHVYGVVPPVAASVAE